MCMMPILIVASVLGVKWGWEPVAGGGVEYIIRIEPHAVEALRSGRDIFSDLPPQIQRVRSYRVTVSNVPVPHEGELPPVDSTGPVKSDAAAQSARNPPSGSATAARQPVNDPDPSASDPPAAGAPFADTPLIEQQPPAFQPPATPPAADAPNSLNNQRQGWPQRANGADGASGANSANGTQPTFAPPPGANSGITDLGPPQTGPAATATGPALQPAGRTWPNRPSYDQPLAQGAAAAPTNQPSGYGQPPPAATNDWYNPPTAGQAPRNGQPSRSAQNSAGQGFGSGGQYGDRDLFGRQQNNGSPSFSTPAKHANGLTGAEQELTAVAESKPWVLVVTLLVLFASVGLNVYLGMIAWDLYERYRVTIDQLKTATEARVA